LVLKTSPQANTLLNAFQSLHYRRAAPVTSGEAEHCLSAASCAGALGTKPRRMKIMQGELSFCFVFLFSQKKNDVAEGESFCFCFCFCSYNFITN